MILESEPMISWDLEGNLSITCQSKQSLITLVLAIPIDWDYQRRQSGPEIRQSLVHLNQYIQHLQEHSTLPAAPLEVSRLGSIASGTSNYFLYVNSDNQVILQCQQLDDTIFLKFPVSRNPQFVEWLTLLKLSLEKLIPSRSVGRCYVS